MAGDVIGSAVVEVTADASGLSAGIAQATQAVKGFEAAAAGSGARAGAAMSKANKDASITSAQLTREQERLIASITNYGSTLGKSRGEVLEYRAAQAGIADQVQAQIAAIRAQEAALASSGKALNRYGVSAGQTAQALRQVPAQLSDIVVSLQGGQAPLTVLLQQGSQLKDSFGGVVPAAKALGGAVLGLINPYTLAAAAAATLGVAYYQGSKEADGYRRALILTGNVAGTSAGQLAQMAASIDVVVGTQGQAAAALTALAGSGQVASANLEKFATTAVRTQRTIGTSVEDTAKAFAELGQEPLKASEKLNQGMNYLTLSLYEQIKALDDQGRKTEAAAVAQRAYDAALDTATKRLEGNLGTIERTMLALTDSAKGMWDAILDVGRQQSPQSQLSAAEKAVDALQRTYDSRQSRGLATGDVKPQLDAAQAYLETQREGVRLANRQVTAQGEAVRISRDAIAAAQANAKWSEAALSTQEKTNRALEVYRANNAKINAARASEGRDPLSARQIGAEEAAIIKANAGPKAAVQKAYQDDGATKYLQQLRETGATLEAQLAIEQKIGNEAKKLLEFEQLISDLKTKGSLTADQKSYIAQQDLLRGQLQHNALNERLVELKDAQAKKDKEAIDAMDKFKERAAQINEQMERANATRSAGFDASLSTYGMGDRARAQASDRVSVRREYDGYRTQTDRKLSSGVLNSDEYAAAVAKIQENLNQAYASVEDYYRRDAAARGNWVNGATRALQNYADEASDVAKHTEEVFTDAFRGLEDQFTNLLTGKKFDVKSLMAQLNDDIARNFVKENITGPLARVGNDLFGTRVFDSVDGQRGSSASNPLYVRNADAVSGITSAVKGGSGSGSWLDTAFSIGSSLYGGFGNTAATSMANSAGTGLDGLFRYTNNFSGRAGGGWVGPRSTYEVAENAPELLTVGNKTMLMTGNQSGQVTPLKEERRAASPFIVNFAVQGKISTETQTQVAQKLRRETQTAAARF